MGERIIADAGILQNGTVPFTGDQSMGGHLLTNVADPVSPQDAATRAFVLALANGLAPKQNVSAVTTAALPSTAAIIYNNGALGVGATLTRGENGALGTVDGFAPVLNARYLVMNQAAPAQNGLYTLTALGSGAAPYVLTRATDADVFAEIPQGTSVFVTGAGSLRLGSQWILFSAVAVVGTDAQNWQAGAIGFGASMPAAIAGAASVGTGAGAAHEDHTHAGATGAQGAKADTATQPADLAAYAQPLDTDLTAIAALTAAANKVLINDGAGAWALVSCFAAGRAMLAAADAAAQTVLLGFGVVTAYGASLVSAVDAAAARALLSLGTAALSAATDFATSAQGTKADNALPKAGGTMSGAIAMGASKVTGLAVGSAAGDATALEQAGKTIISFGDAIGTGYTLVTHTYYVDPWFAAGPAGTNSRKIIVSAGVIHRMFICVPVNAITGTGATVTFTLQKNGVDTGMLVAYTSVTTVAVQTITTGAPVTVADGDQLSLHLEITGTTWTGSFTGLQVSVEICNA